MHAAPFLLPRLLSFVSSHVSRLFLVLTRIDLSPPPPPPPYLSPSSSLCLTTHLSHSLGLEKLADRTFFLLRTGRVANVGRVYHMLRARSTFRLWVVHDAVAAVA